MVTQEVGISRREIGASPRVAVVEEERGGLRGGRGESSPVMNSHHLQLYSWDR